MTKCPGNPAGKWQLRHQIPEPPRACLGRWAHKAESFQKLENCAGGAGPRQAPLLVEMKDPRADTDALATAGGEEL